MLYRCLFSCLLLLSLSYGSFAQIERVIREKPYVPVSRPQNSLRPQAAAVSGVGIPPVAMPVDTIYRHGVPDGRLGRSVPQLFNDFPGIRIVDGSGERVIYQTRDSIIFEILDNRVVVARSLVKGNWKYPNEEWYQRIVDKAKASGYVRHVFENNVHKFFYETFTFTIRYKRNVDIYDIRFEYLPSHYPHSQHLSE